MRFRDVTGRKYGRLTVKSFSHKKKGRSFWLCVCSCGNEIIASVASLNYGNTQSCGCLQKETVAKLGKSKTTHGKTTSPLYSIWHGMRKRCHCKTSEHYPRYGGRGIQVCAEWNDFSEFEKWMYESGYVKGLTIDRINNDGDYCPSNCRLATAKEQARNRSDTTMYRINGVELPLIEWAERLGVVYSKAYYRFRQGKPPFTHQEIMEGKVWQ